MDCQVRKLDVCGRPLFANPVTYVYVDYYPTRDLLEAFEADLTQTKILH